MAIRCLRHDASGTYSKMAEEITLARVVQAGVVPMDTAAVASEIQRSWKRDDAQQWAEVYTKIFPNYQLLIESYLKAQDVQKNTRAAGFAAQLTYARVPARVGTLSTGDPSCPVNRSATRQRSSADPAEPAFIIIDYQPVQVNSIASMDRQLLVNNIVGTAKAAVAWPADRIRRRTSRPAPEQAADSAAAPGAG